MEFYSNLLLYKIKNCYPVRFFALKSRAILVSHSKKDLAKDWRINAEFLINKGVADVPSRFESTSVVEGRCRVIFNSKKAQAKRKFAWAFR